MRDCKVKMMRDCKVKMMRDCKVGPLKQKESRKGLNEGWDHRSLVVKQRKSKTFPFQIKLNGIGLY